MSKPKLYVFDSCPFSMRARFALGLFDIEFDKVVMAFNDAKTPEDLVGKKTAPILQIGDLTMCESMDIVHYIDENLNNGDNVFADDVDPTIEEWNKNIWEIVNNLVVPRVPLLQLPELPDQSAIDYYNERHSKWEDREGLIANTPSFIEDLQPYLEQASNFIKSPDSINGEKITINDMHVFGRLASLTFVEDIQFPANVELYLHTLAEKAGVELYYNVEKR
eukprot:TRINITY_DN11378_c0_g1_i1.p1 TRINITY_DN11378_c0_g1~~TRINITY_DN11378_c0_g1_i1.p1  ORF type:complete len:221 (-),score=48.58 TRINITY_DN11378_c0_g1_i1:89-751(-)